MPQIESNSGWRDPVRCPVPGCTQNLTIPGLEQSYCPDHGWVTNPRTGERPTTVGKAIVRSKTQIVRLPAEGEEQETPTVELEQPPSTNSEQLDLWGGGAA